MRDGDLRSALRASLDLEHRADSASTRIVDELGLCGLARVDVAVVNGALSGYELKSARDSLDRLPNQVKIYSEVLDNAVLVVAENHLKSARRMLKPWWGISLAVERQGQVQIETVRGPKRNPRIRKASLVQLLWKDEAILALQERGLDRGLRSRPRHLAWERLALELELDDLRDVVRSALKARREWRVDPARDARGATLRHERMSSRFLARRFH